MNDFAVLRLYIPMSARARATRLWHHLSPPQLAHQLLTQARRAGIRQALLFHVGSGYLPGEKPSHAHVEGTAARYPQCVELVDTEEALRAFLVEHHAQLHAVQAVLLRCELPLATEGKATHASAG
jgi:PII-like signaling protein